MTSNIFKTVFLSLLVFVAVFSRAQEISFVCKVSKTKLAKGQNLRVSFTVNKENTDDFTPPDFEGFKLLGGPSSSIANNWINGVTTYSKSFSYVISPKKKGTLTIKSATINFKGKKIKSNTVQIQVVNPSALPQNPNDPYYKASRSVFIKTRVSKNKPYVGEGIYVEYVLYFKYPISNYHPQQMPKYVGFWNQQIPTKNINVKQTTYNGEQYNIAVMSKSVLVPQRAGRLELDPMAFDVVVGIPTGQYDWFGNPVTKNVSLQVESKKQFVLVNELPLKEKPSNFNGAVGDFTLSLKTSSKTVKIYESLQVRVAISGAGNLNQITLPTLQVPPNLELYKPERKENFKLSIAGIKGNKGNITDIYTIVPQKEGNYKIPALSFSYFSPKDKKYHRLQTDDIWVNATASGKLLGQNNSGTSQNLNGNTSVSKIAVNAKKTMRYLQQKTVFVPTNRVDFFRSVLFYGLIFIGLLLFPLTVLIVRVIGFRKKDTAQNRSRTADALARKYLTTARKKINQSNEFYEALEKALYNYLKAKMRVDVSQINKETVREMFAKKGVSTTLTEDFIVLLSACDLARYTPVNEGMATKHYKKAKKIIAQVNSYF